MLLLYVTGLLAWTNPSVFTRESHSRPRPSLRPSLHNNPSSPPTDYAS